MSDRKIPLQIKKHGGDNAAVSCCFKCIHCCLACFEKTLKYLNRNAYIMVAVHGSNFCVSAYKSFTLLAANVLRVAAINTVGDFVLFLAKVAIVVATVFAGIEIVHVSTLGFLADGNYFANQISDDR